MAQDYTISIKALIDVNGTTSGTSKAPLSGGNAQPVNTSSKQITNNDKMNDSLNAMAQLSGINHMAQQGGKFVSTFGDNGSKMASQLVSKAMNYTMKGVTAFATMNPVQIADLALDIVCDIGQQVRQLQVEQATIKNEQDLARIQAGFLNVENTKVKASFWDGRYSYARRQ